MRAPLTVEYWKSAPYFFNFLNGYQVGERLGAEMKIPDRRARLTPLFRGAQRIVKSEVEQFHPVDWGNARLRALAAETLDQGWWRLLWMPPSLPYHALGGPYESVNLTEITKRLIFSSITTTVPQFGHAGAGNRFAGGKTTKLQSAPVGRHEMC